MFGLGSKAVISIDYVEDTKLAMQVMNDCGAWYRIYEMVLGVNNNEISYRWKIEIEGGDCLKWAGIRRALDKSGVDYRVVRS